MVYGIRSVVSGVGVSATCDVREGDRVLAYLIFIHAFAYLTFPASS